MTLFVFVISGDCWYWKNNEIKTRNHRKLLSVLYDSHDKSNLVRAELMPQHYVLVFPCVVFFFSNYSLHLIKQVLWKVQQDHSFINLLTTKSERALGALKPYFTSNKKNKASFMKGATGPNRKSRLLRFRSKFIKLRNLSNCAIENG